MNGRLTAYETEGMPSQMASKTWSPEARAAALAARRRNAHRQSTSERSGNPTIKRAHELSGTAHDTTDKVNKKPTADGHRIAAFAHSIAADAQAAHGNNALAEAHRALEKAHAAEAAKPKPGKVNRDKVRYANEDDSGRGHDKPLEGERFKPKESTTNRQGFRTGDQEQRGRKPSARDVAFEEWQREMRKKPGKKEFFSTGDAVELKTKPGRLLVIDAGIDAKRGPWVAVREDKPGVAGSDQRRFVALPGELKAWSDAAREAAAEARRRGAGGGSSENINHSKIRELLKQHAKLPGVSGLGGTNSDNAMKLSARAVMMNPESEQGSKAHARAADAHDNAIHSGMSSGLKKLHQELSKIHTSMLK